MKRIIYNTKLKKKVIAMLLIMLLFNFIFSCMGNVVYADAESGANDAGVTREMFYPKKDSKIVPPEEFDEYFGAGTENSTNWKYDKWNIELGKIMKEHEGKPYASYVSAGASVFNKSLKESYDSNKKNTEKITLKDAYIKAVDAAMEKSVEIKENAEEQTAKNEVAEELGGILLSPVFYLINFIADAIISNLGNIMLGEGLSAFDGLAVLTDSPDSSGYNNANMETHYVDVSSFKADLGTLFTGATYQYPNLKYTPEEIFSGKIDLLSIDFITGTNYKGEENENEGWLNIRKVISQWYQILRMIAIIGFLSVLIYTGIKITISATAKDKAKYKEWIINWIMGAAILFFMHIIMAFIVALTGEFSKLMSEAYQGVNVMLSDGNSFVTNLMGLVRFMIQSENFYIKVGYEVMYIALICYTIKFTFLYLKRVLNMAFLTLIAPIVALTYPIDKINDGSAQGFDMWLKEYIFNALLQPMHCILYYVLVGSAVSIAATNPIYGIVVLAFMSEAEKLLKKIFGFGKAGATSTTNGSMVSALAAGTIASNIAKNFKLASGGGGGKGGSGNAGKEQSLFDNPKGNKPGMDVFNGEETLLSGGPSAAVAFQNSNDSVGDTERDALEEKVADRQILEDELTDEQNAILGRNTSSSLNGGQATEVNNNSDDGQPVREKGKFANGAKAVGKRLLKPVWDADKSKGYNFKRLARGAGKAAIGFSLGTAAAAVQAGISITDGKYNPLEAVGTMAAGFAGTEQMFKKGESLLETYKEGALPTNSEARKAAIMERAKSKFADRDDVIEFNKKNYAGQEKQAMERQRDNYLTAGVTDLKDMKAGMKYADKLVGDTTGLTADQIKAKREAADRRAAATIDFKKTLQEQGQAKAIYDKEKQQKYIQSMVDKAADGDKERVRARYENAFKSVAAYDAANS